jgi:uncharacterized membrane protein YidH (DUF202 family)
MAAREGTMFSKHPKEKTFFGVAMFIILLGVIVLVIGLLQWFYNWWYLDYAFAMPSAKVIGGLIVIALGYIQLELELIRTHKRIKE